MVSSKKFFLSSSGCSFLALLCLVIANPALAQVLTLTKAEALALANDPDLALLTADRLAMLDEAAAAEQLPDPLLRFGAVGLPVDSFALDQENMTQLQVGVSQQFSKGATRRLTRRRGEELAGAKSAQRIQREMEILLAVRQSYLDVLAEIRARGFLREELSAMGQLRELVLDLYGSGVGRQQDVDQVELQRLRIEQRLLGVDQMEDRYRAQLAIYLAESAWQPIDEEWPVLPPAPESGDLMNGLARHPAVRAVEAEVQAAQTSVDIAGEQYKPGFRVDLTYGDRFGEGFDGHSRPDLFSAMVTMDLPIFRDRRQDRQLSASRLRLVAVEERRADMLRRLAAQASGALIALERVDRRLALYAEQVLPQARAHADSALEDYQSGTGDLSEVIRARLTVQQLLVEQVRVRAERLGLLADLQYLAAQS